MKKRLAPRRTTAAGAFLAAITLLARGASADDAKALPEVVVTDRKEGYKPEKASGPKITAPLRDVPQTLTVVPEAVTKAQGSASLREVLRNVPGISIQAGEGGVPAGDNLSIRGFGARTDLFIDGARDIGGYTRDPFDFEQIEVSKGPASTYAGRGSTGGSVNMATKTPRADGFVRGELTGGSAQYKRVTADVNQPLAPLGLETAALRLNLLGHDAHTPGRDYVFTRRWGLAPALTYGLGSPTKLTLTHLHLASDGLPDYGIPWVPETNNALVAYRQKSPPVDFKNFYGLLDRDFEHTVTDVTTAVVDHEHSDALSVRNLTRYGRTYRNSVVTAPRFQSVNSDAVVREYKGRDQADSILLDQLDLTWKFKTGPVEHTAVTGAEAGLERSDAAPKLGATAVPTSLYAPDPNQPYNVVQSTGPQAYARSQSAALYAFDTMRFGERWELSGGLRYDRFDTGVRSVTAQTGGHDLTTQLGRLDEMLSGRGALVFKPVPHGSVYAGYGTSFNPSAEGLTLANTATATNGAGTAPEESRSYEVGTKWDLFDEQLSLGAALFRTEKLNARTEDPNNPADFIVLEGRQRVDGVELSAAGSPLEGVNLFGGYTYLDGKVLDSRSAGELGAPLANTPRHSANLWATWAPVEKVELGFGANYVGDRFSAQTAARRWAPGYKTFDAMLAFKPRKDLTLRLNGYNLGNERYIDRLSGGHFVPGPSRAVQGTVSVSL